MLILRGTGPSYREVPDGTPERDIIQNLHNDIQVKRYIGEPAMEASATTTSVIRYSVWKWLLTFIGAKEIHGVHRPDALTILWLPIGTVSAPALL